MPPRSVYKCHKKFGKLKKSRPKTANINEFPYAVTPLELREVWSHRRALGWRSIRLRLELNAIKESPIQEPSVLPIAASPKRSLRQALADAG